MKQQTTPWFSYSTPPKRRGWYKCSCGNKHFWFGDPVCWRAYSAQGHKWRGLTKEAK